MITDAQVSAIELEYRALCGAYRLLGETDLMGMKFHKWCRSQDGKSKAAALVVCLWLDDVADV